MINDFGKEDKSFINDNDLINILKCHFRGISKLVKLIYCNPNIPFNNNIKYIKNNEKELEILENGEFRIVNKEYIIDTIILDTWTILNNCYEKLNRENLLEDFKTSLICNETWERLTEFIQAYHKFKNGDDINIENIREDIFNTIKLFSKTPTLPDKPDKPKKLRRKSTKY
jgi:hypothetical protein